jgi:rRNA-processing protein FCF1
MKVLLDTNFILIPFTLNVDVFSQFRNRGDELFVLDRSLVELEYLTRKGNGVDKLNAKMALESVEKCGISVISSEESFKKVDESIIDVAEEQNLAVATQDKELKQMLREKGLKVYYLRQKRYIMRD